MQIRLNYDRVTIKNNSTTLFHVFFFSHLGRVKRLPAFPSSFSRKLSVQYLSGMWGIARHNNNYYYSYNDNTYNMNGIEVGKRKIKVLINHFFVFRVYSSGKIIGKHTWRSNMVMWPKIINDLNSLKWSKIEFVSLLIFKDRISHLTLYFQYVQLRPFITNQNSIHLLLVVSFDYLCQTYERISC